MKLKTYLLLQLQQAAAIKHKKVLQDLQNYCTTVAALISILF